MTMTGLLLACFACADVFTAPAVVNDTKEVDAVVADDLVNASAKNHGTEVMIGSTRVENAGEPALHGVQLALIPDADSAGNAWSIVPHPRYVNKVISGITVVKDIRGVYTDTSGRKRTIRDRHGYGVWAASIGVADSRNESFYIACTADWSGIPSSQTPDGDISVDINYVVQFAERENQKPYKVRPDNRKGWHSVTCPQMVTDTTTTKAAKTHSDEPHGTAIVFTSTAYYYDDDGDYYTEAAPGRVLDHHSISVAVTPTTDAEDNSWSMAIPEGQTVASEVYDDVADEWEVAQIVSVFTDVLGNGYMDDARFSTGWVMCLDPGPVTVHYNVDYATRDQPNPTHVRPEGRTDAVVLQCEGAY